jgi:C4-dicarboxylate transporter DctM subunit
MREDNQMGMAVKIYKNFESYGIIIGTIGMIGVTVLQIVGRITNIHVPWTIELNRYLLIYISFLGLSEAAKRQEHIGTEFLSHLVGPREKYYLWVVVQILFLIFSIYIVYSGFEMVLMHYYSNQLTVSLPYNFSIAFISLILPVGFIFTSLHLTGSIYSSIKEKRITLTRQTGE